MGYLGASFIMITWRHGDMEKWISVIQLHSHTSPRRQGPNNIEKWPLTSSGPSVERSFRCGIVMACGEIDVHEWDASAADLQDFLTARPQLVSGGRVMSLFYPVLRSVLMCSISLPGWI